VLCVCVYAHAHTLHVGYSDVSPGVGTRHLESPEEIQMCCSDSIHIYLAVYEVHQHVYMLGYRVVPAHGNWHIEIAGLNWAGFLH